MIGPLDSNRMAIAIRIRNGLNKRSSIPEEAKSNALFMNGVFAFTLKCLVNSKVMGSCIVIFWF